MALSHQKNRAYLDALGKQMLEDAERHVSDDQLNQYLAQTPSDTWEDAELDGVFSIIADR